jgi:hypothetical protein
MLRSTSTPDSDEEHLRAGLMGDILCRLIDDDIARLRGIDDNQGTPMVSSAEYRG